ncbi:MAG: SEC-C metal-binding domain-containing protein [Myxococcales bacterium]
MSMARAMGREREARRWTGATIIPAVHGAARWAMGEHAAVREYLEAQESAHGQPGEVPESEIGRLAARLYESGATREERKELLAFLAHHGTARATSELQRFVERCEPGLLRFAELAYEEALGRAQPAARTLGRQEPCPCGSGSKFKDCCARGLS